MDYVFLVFANAVSLAYIGCKKTEQLSRKLRSVEASVFGSLPYGSSSSGCCWNRRERKLWLFSLALKRTKSPSHSDHYYIMPFKCCWLRDASGDIKTTWTTTNLQFSKGDDIKGLVHPKWKFCQLLLTLMSFRTVRPSFIFGIQMKIFLMKSESFLTIHRQQSNWHVRGQKDSKEIIKIIHVTSVVQPNVMKLREQVLCAKKKKNDSLLSLRTKSILVAS